MTEQDLRQLLVRLDTATEREDSRPITKLLELAAALNNWDYPCVTKVECGIPVQDANYVGDIELAIADSGK